MNAKDIEKQTDSNTNSISLIQKDLSYMADGIKDIKESVRSLTESMNNGFATKTEVRVIDKRITELEDLKGWAVKIILGAIIAGLLALLGLGTR